MKLEKLLEEINGLGARFFELGYQNKRIAIVGRNRYEWALTHLANLLRKYSFNTLR